MTREAFIQLIRYNILYTSILMALTIFVYSTAWIIAFRLGLRIICSKPCRIYPAVLFMTAFSFAKQFIPIKVYGVLMVALVSIFLQIISGTKIIKAVWASLLTILATGLGDLLIFAPIAVNRNTVNFFFQTIYGNLAVSSIEAFFPFVLLCILNKYKNISLIPPLEKINLYNSTAVVTFGALFYLVFNATIKLYISLKNNSQSVYADLVSQWIAAIAAGGGCFLLLNILKKRYENERRKLEEQREYERQQYVYEQRLNEERIMGLKEQNLQLERLIAHLEKHNINQQEVVGAVEGVKGSINQLIDNNNKIIDRAKSNVIKPPHVLTDREIQLLRLIVEDKTNKEIATSMFLHLGTVKTNISDLLKKLGLRRRVHLAIYAVKYGVVKEEEINL